VATKFGRNITGKQFLRHITIFAEGVTPLTANFTKFHPRRASSPLSFVSRARKVARGFPVLARKYSSTRFLRASEKRDMRKYLSQ